MCSSWRDIDWPRGCGNRATCSIMRTVYMYIDGMPVRVCLSDRGHISGIHVQCSSTFAEQRDKYLPKFCQIFDKSRRAHYAVFMHNSAIVSRLWRHCTLCQRWTWVHFSSPNPTQPITHLREMQTPVLQNPHFYRSFISQLCLLKNKGKRMSISVIPVYCSGSKKSNI